MKINNNIEGKTPSSSINAPSEEKLVNETSKLGAREQERLAEQLERERLEALKKEAEPPPELPPGQDEKPKRKYKKRVSKKDPNAESEEPFVNIDGLFNDAVEFGLPFLAARMPNPIPPTEKEIEWAKRVTNGLAEKYAPVVATWGVELNAGLFLASFGLPRLFGRAEEQLPVELAEQLQKTINDGTTKSNSDSGANGNGQK